MQRSPSKKPSLGGSWCQKNYLQPSGSLKLGKRRARNKDEWTCSCWLEPTLSQASPFTQNKEWFVAVPAIHFYVIDPLLRLVPQSRHLLAHTFNGFRGVYLDDCDLQHLMKSGCNLMVAQLRPPEAVLLVRDLRRSTNWVVNSWNIALKFNTVPHASLMVPGEMNTFFRDSGLQEMPHCFLWCSIHVIRNHHGQSILKEKRIKPYLFNRNCSHITKMYRSLLITSHVYWSHRQKIPLPCIILCFLLPW